MKKFNVNIHGNFNIYGEVIPINAFYGKINDTIYYCCKTSQKDIDILRQKYPLVNNVLPLPIYIWQGEEYGFVLKLDYGKIAQTIYNHAEKSNAWNTGVKRDICYGIGRTLDEKTDFITQVVRNHKTKAIKDGSKYHAKHRHKNVGEIPLNVGECIISHTFNTMNTRH